MKVFISWSGERSRKVAELLNDWLECVLQSADPWMSSKGIDRGSLWFSEINGQLATTKVGIVCLTKGNLNKPWILFESGALAKGLTSNKVCTFLIDLEPKDISDPLAQFNHTLPNKEGLYKLISTLNNEMENSLKEKTLEEVFSTYFPKFEKDFEQILSTSDDDEVEVERSEYDILNDVLNSVRSVEKRIRNIEAERLKDQYKDFEQQEALQRQYRLRSQITNPDSLFNDEIKRKNINFTVAGSKPPLPPILGEKSNTEIDN